mmetsp:Transcript_49921/g.57486  ORF Transcript_49921/g.57486 Transcript_49921/m.57486 type:complete len:237 (-) Transcript_49921:151-861(-)
MISDECITSTWEKNLQKSITGNLQLEFWRNINIAYLASSTKIPEAEMLKYKKTISHEDGTICLVSILDARSKIYKDLEGNEIVSLCWYFPLSKEKYRIKAKLTRIVKDFYEGKKDQSYFEAKKFQEIWEKELSKEERKEFTELTPDTVTEEKSIKEHDDLNDFGTPEVTKISRNFAVLLFEVLEVELTRYKMPQVIADSRYTPFESLFAPYKVTTKYLHTRSKEDLSKWETVPLNP